MYHISIIKFNFSFSFFFSQEVEIVETLVDVEPAPVTEESTPVTVGKKIIAFDFKISVRENLFVGCFCFTMPKYVPV